MSMKLTPKQDKFCREYLKTSNASEAYRRSYDAKNMGVNTIKVKASQLLSRDNIRITVDRLREKIEDEGILTFKEIQKMLSERAKEELNADGLKSIDILNKMAGNYEKDNTQSNKIITVAYNNLDDYYEDVNKK